MTCTIANLLHCKLGWHYNTLEHSTLMSQSPLSGPASITSRMMLSCPISATPSQRQLSLFRIRGLILNGRILYNFYRCREIKYFYSDWLHQHQVWQLHWREVLSTSQWWCCYTLRTSKPGGTGRWTTSEMPATHCSACSLLLYFCL